MTSRIVTLIDMDCFYVQVEEKLNPEVKGTPAVVVQYKPYRGGGIIAVNYEARAKGIKRGGTHGDDAKKICPEVHIFQIPEVRGKADLTRYRDASKDVFKVLTSFSDCVERASIDEAYIDLTDIVEKRLKDVRDSGVKLRDYLCAEKFGNTFASGCDGGIGVWLNKVLPSEESDEDDEMIDGDEASEREFSDHVRLTMGALFVEEMRAAVFEATGFRCSAGISHNKTLSKLGCGLNKPNKQTIMPMDAVPQLFSSMPISKNKRMAKTMTVGVSLGMNKNMTRGKHLSRSCPLACYSAARIGADAYKIISKINTAKEPDW
ncbi:unnamed protein product [Notodromas monacha]|uniref:UmuC domain-containing protein n=1 Tax=Notodromas monacha TaxID=399045 RepID=A0A7R9GHI8_9CRUS|nr:unnamed protein product [Notodromas monacha]CAG0921390.1 unnamed protein product [Notodromas monacha]